MPETNRFRCFIFQPLKNARTSERFTCTHNPFLFLPNTLNDEKVLTPLLVFVPVHRRRSASPNTGMYARLLHPPGYHHKHPAAPYVLTHVHVLRPARRLHRSAVQPVHHHQSTRGLLRLSHQQRIHSHNRRSFQLARRSHLYL